MESFAIFISSAIVDHIILYNSTKQRFVKCLGMTCNCIWGTETAFKIKKQKKILLMHKIQNVFRQDSDFKDF